MNKVLKSEQESRNNEQKLSDENERLRDDLSKSEHDLSDEKQKNQRLRDDLSKSKHDLSVEKHKNQKSFSGKQKSILQHPNKLIETFIKKKIELLKQKLLKQELPKREFKTQELLVTIRNDFDWKTFVNGMNILYRKFPEKFELSYPNLTKIDMLICCLSILKVENKEIIYFFESSNADYINNRRRKIRNELKMDANIDFAKQLLKLFKKKPL